MKNTKTTLQGLFLASLADIYDAENRLVRALPRLAKAATHNELKNAFRSHLKETENHIKKVEKVFATFGAKAKRRHCPAIVGLLAEGDEMAVAHKGRQTLNAALIAAAQKIEHYEIATYGTLREWAELLGNSAAAGGLEEVLDQEKTADRTLTEIARLQCNPAAATAGALRDVRSEIRPGVADVGELLGGRRRLSSKLSPRLTPPSLAFACDFAQASEFNL